jgi:UDP-3-O-acyl N-acetylglucosamine deacetylase
MTSRQTVARPVSVRGTGLHTGAAVTLTFQPAPCGFGVRFRRTDIGPSADVGATLDRVAQSHRRTLLANDGVEVSTVEHVLAAAAGLGLDDLLIVLDGPEPPAMDGSAAAFSDALADAGAVQHPRRPTIVRIHEPFTISDGDASYRVAPSPGLTLDVTVEWSHPVIGRQRGVWTIGRDTFLSELASARTFGFAREHAALAASGLAAGATSYNTIVLDDGGLVNGPLRWPDEFVRHKALDLLGDLALLGARLHATVVAERPSHRGNRALVQALRARSPAMGRVA